LFRQKDTVMKMSWKLLRQSCAILTSGAVVFSGMPATAQQPSPPEQSPPPQQSEQPAAQPLGQAQLETLVAPIALYPDDLVAQILTASTYPLEVVEAERWVQGHPNVAGDALQDALQQLSWDASVKGLTAVPQVLAMMSEKLDWTQQVGEAFLAQPNDVSNAIQQLRTKAAANGNLKSSKQLKVSTVAAPASQTPPPPPPPGVDPATLPPPPPPEYTVIEPADSETYYVPIYDPTVVYGAWAWPDYSPFYWYPPGYVIGGAVIGFGVGVFVGAALWSHYNWAGGRVAINVARYNRFNHANLVAGSGGFSNWQFNATHRGVVGFHNTALRQQYGRGTGPGTSSGTFQGNRSTNVAPGGTGSLNARTAPTGNVDRNVTVNKNVSIDRNTTVNTNVNKTNNVNRTVNQNATTTRNATVTRSTNTTRTVTSNTNRNASGNNKQHH
jgi:Protein of unknown function (DUF3300)